MIQIGNTAVHVGDCLESLLAMPERSVNCCVTSPPYWGLRDYGTARWDGGDAECDHKKVSDAVAAVATSTLGGGKKTTGHQQEGFKQRCGKCGAVRVDNQLGLEPTPEAYVAKMVEVFREVRRVLRDDGTLWLNLGDSYAASTVANLSDCIASRLKHSVLFFGSADPRGRTAEGIHVLIYDKGSPDRVFSPLFAAKTVTVKDGQDDLCQIGGRLDTPVTCWASRSLGLGVPSNANTKCVVNMPENVGIIVAAGNLHSDAALVDTISGAIKNGQATFAVEVSGKPETERVSSVVSTWDAVTLYAGAECGTQVDLVDDPVALLDGSDFSASDFRDIRVSHAAGKHVSFALKRGRDLCFCGERHLYSLNGGVTPFYTTVASATRDFNAKRPKQELGIPEMVKRALMEDGWICRQTIIWAKPNPMPESVTDRCTKAHEYVFLMAKSERYFYDADAVKELAIGCRGGAPIKARDLSFLPGASRLVNEGLSGGWDGSVTRNRRSVWQISTRPYKGAHFATFPPALIEPCIKAGCPVGGTVLDPFGGSGTTGRVANDLGRNAVLCELNPKYVDLIRERLTAPAKPLKKSRKKLVPA